MSAILYLTLAPQQLNTTAQNLAAKLLRQPDHKIQSRQQTTTVNMATDPIIRSLFIDIAACATSWFSAKANLEGRLAIITDHMWHYLIRPIYLQIKTIHYGLPTKQNCFPPLIPL